MMKMSKTIMENISGKCTTVAMDMICIILNEIVEYVKTHPECTTENVVTDVLGKPHKVNVPESITRPKLERSSAKKPTSGQQQEKVTCKYILQKGKRRGQSCGKTADPNTGYCSACRVKGQARAANRKSELQEEKVTRVTRTSSSSRAKKPEPSSNDLEDSEEGGSPQSPESKIIVDNFPGQRDFKIIKGTNIVLKKLNGGKYQSVGVVEESELGKKKVRKFTDEEAEDVSKKYGIKVGKNQEKDEDKETEETKETNARRRKSSSSEDYEEIDDY